LTSKRIKPGCAAHCAAAHGQIGGGNDRLNASAGGRQRRRLFQVAIDRLRQQQESWDVSWKYSFT
jgi:hypothetical protein